MSAHTQTETKKTHTKTNKHTHTLAHTQVDNTWHTNLFCERTHTNRDKKHTHRQTHTHTHTHTLAHRQVDNTWHTNLFCERKLLVGREERPEDHNVTSQAMKNVRDNGEIRNTIRGEGSTTLYTAHIVYTVYTVKYYSNCFTLLKQ